MSTPIQHPFPQLIQEILYFYECKIRIKRLHEEYKVVVSVGYNGRVLMLRGGSAIILTDRQYRRRNIWNFTGCCNGMGIRYVCKVSKSHNFTSGMTNRAGYNNNVDTPIFDTIPTNFVDHHQRVLILRNQI